MLPTLRFHGLFTADADTVEVTEATKRNGPRGGGHPDDPRRKGRLLRKEEDAVTLNDVKEILEADVLVGNDQLGKSVKTAFAADLMSDVLAFAKPDSLLLTGLTNPQVVRTADILDITAIIMVRGKKPSEETVKLAEELKIPILSTRYILFETSGRLHAKGITGCIEKVGGET
jgi:predicted transcriptional regulator